MDAYNLIFTAVIEYAEAVNAEHKRLSEAVRAACLKAARNGYEQASMSGLCHAGAMEAALDAMQALDLETMVREVLASTPTERT